MQPVIATRRDDHDPGVRLAAAEAIAFLPEAPDLLVECLKDKDPNLRAYAVAAVATEMTSAAIGEMIITHVDDRTTFLSAVEVQKASSPRR
ncbi:MAG: HEAT repeat domain-containing protein [Pseudomonadota bacterium]